MKPRNFTLFLGLSLTILAVIVWSLTGKPASKPSLRKGSAPPKVVGLSPTISENPDAAPNSPSPTETPSAPLNQLALLEEINEAAVTYDAKALPRIQPYLTHADPEVREAAKNGMIVLGDAAAGPLLREASRKAASPQEAVALLEAADYVELPSASLLLKREKAPNPPVPSP